MPEDDSLRELEAVLKSLMPTLEVMLSYTSEGREAIDRKKLLGTSSPRSEVDRLNNQLEGARAYLRLTVADKSFKSKLKRLENALKNFERSIR